MIVSVFAQNVATLIVTIGFGTGLGLGLIYLPAIVSVTQYFEAKRSLATGIAVCGSGFGTVVFAPVVDKLINNYGWRGTMLIFGGIVLNCIIFGAMFRPLEAPRPKAVKVTAKKAAIIDQNATRAELEPLKANTLLKPVTDQYLQLPQRTDAPHSGGGNGLCRSNSVGHNLKPSMVGAAGTATPTMQPFSSMTLSLSHWQNNNSNGLVNGQALANATIAVKSTSNDDITRTFASQPQLMPLRDSHREHSASGTMYRPDALYQVSLMLAHDCDRCSLPILGLTAQYTRVHKFTQRCLAIPFRFRCHQALRIPQAESSLGRESGEHCITLGSITITRIN